MYTDEPRGIHHGIGAIKAELQSFVKVTPSTIVDVKTLVANGGTVMAERVDNFEIQGKPFGLEVAAVFEVDGSGRIKRWRDYYDLRSIEDRIAAALARQADHSIHTDGLPGTRSVSGHATANAPK